MPFSNPKNPTNDLSWLWVNHKEQIFSDTYSQKYKITFSFYYTTKNRIKNSTSLKTPYILPKRLSSQNRQLRDSSRQGHVQQIPIYFLPLQLKLIQNLFLSGEVECFPSYPHDRHISKCKNSKIPFFTDFFIYVYFLILSIPTTPLRPTICLRLSAS